MTYVNVFIVFFGFTLAALFGIWLVVTVLGIQAAILIFGGATIVGLVAVIIEWLTERSRA